jgi:hypothetical protein
MALFVFVCLSDVITAGAFRVSLELELIRLGRHGLLPSKLFKSSALQTDRGLKNDYIPPRSALVVSNAFWRLPLCSPLVEREIATRVHGARCTIWDVSTIDRIVANTSAIE